MLRAGAAGITGIDNPTIGFTQAHFCQDCFDVIFIRDDILQDSICESRWKISIPIRLLNELQGVLTNRNFFSSQHQAQSRLCQVLQTLDFSWIISWNNQDQPVGSENPVGSIRCSIAIDDILHLRHIRAGKHVRRSALDELLRQCLRSGEIKHYLNTRMSALEYLSHFIKRFC